MENFNPRTYRDLLADNLKEKIKYDKNNAVKLLSEEKDTPEYEEASQLHSYEKEHRIISDQAISYLQAHNLLKENPKKLGELINEDKKSGQKGGLTYKNKVSPYLNIRKIDLGALWLPIRAYQVENAVYWEQRKNFNNMPASVVSDIIEGGPYSHGRELNKCFSEYGLIDIDSIGRDNENLKHIFSYSYMRATQVAAPLMGKIDKSILIFPEYEELFRFFYQLYTDVAPRFITLVACEPGWRLKLMEEFIETRVSQAEIQKIASSFEDRSDDNLCKLARKENLTEGDKQSLINDLSQFVKILQVIDDYLKEKVKYEGEN